MESALTELIKQIPSAVAIIVVVMAFLKRLKESSEGRAVMEASRVEVETLRHTQYYQTLRDLSDAEGAAQEARLKTMESIGESCHAHSEALTERAAGVMEKASTALDENSQMLGRVLEHLRNGS